MNLPELLEEILKITEKAAELARVIRSEEALFKLLVEEKTGETKNKRFVQDFKTLADVLVQEMVRHHLASKFVGIEKNIYGEESNKFTNTLGEAVTVEILNSAEDTCALLCKVLDGNESVAQILSRVIHSPCRESNNAKLSSVHAQVDVDEVGIWIDPIDSTAQYINAVESSCNQGLYQEGLQCVSVLIGVYLKSTGEPIAGVINQPFCYEKDTVWNGRSVWGLCFRDINVFDVNDGVQKSSSENEKKQLPVVLSSSESEQVQSKLREHFQLCYVAGAGYKILSVIDALSSVYLLTASSTSKWDTCGPHAILKSLGGGIVRFDKVKNQIKLSAEGRLDHPEFDLERVLNTSQLTYHMPDCEESAAGLKWSNVGGIVAYINKQSLCQVLKRVLKI